MTAADNWTTRFTKQQRRQMFLRVTVRAIGTTLALFTAYFLWPSHVRTSLGPLTLLILGHLALLSVLVLQIRKILQAQYPILQAIEALSIAIPLLIVVFALVYYLMAQDGSGAFTESLTKMDSLYFTITTLATVGYGDITPVSNAARAVASAQMLLDLVLIGALVRVLFGAARQTAGTRSASDPAPEA